MAHFVPLKALSFASELGKVFLREIVRSYGVPSALISDRGTHFMSKFWGALCSSLEVDLKLSSSYHPQTDGQTERVNQCLEQYLRCYILQPLGSLGRRFFGKWSGI